MPALHKVVHELSESCRCHGLHSFRTANLEQWILKETSDLGSPLFLPQTKSVFFRHGCWGTSHESCLKNGGELSPPHLLNIVKEGQLAQAANMNPQSTVSKHFENRELNAYFKTLMFQTS